MVRGGEQPQVALPTRAKISQNPLRVHSLSIHLTSFIPPSLDLYQRRFPLRFCVTLYFCLWETAATQTRHIHCSVTMSAAQSSSVIPNFYLTSQSQSPTVVLKKHAVVGLPFRSHFCYPPWNSGENFTRNTNAVPSSPTTTRAHLHP